jgi:hypothetical protein
MRSRAPSFRKEGSRESKIKRRPTLGISVGSSSSANAHTHASPSPLGFVLSDSASLRDNGRLSIGGWPFKDSGACACVGPSYIDVAHRSVSPRSPTCVRLRRGCIADASRMYRGSLLERSVRVCTSASISYARHDSLVMTLYGFSNI